jgi:phage protein Gp37/Gp68
MDAPTPTLYDTARRALAAAVSVDEVKEIRDQALAMKVYAEQAKDRQLIEHATELQLRAERRAGELLREMEKNKGGAEKGVGRRGVNNAVAPNDRIPAAKLSDLGISKTQSSRWQRLGALSEEDFERKVAETLEASNSAKAKVIKSITVPKDESAASAAEIEITIPQWNAMSAAEREKYLDPNNFPSDAKLNPQDSDGTDYARNSYSTIVGCKHPCQIYCWAHDVTLRYRHAFPHGFNPVFRPRVLNAPRNTPVPAEAAFDGRYKNVSSNFMSDMFGGWIPRPWIEATLAVERANPQWNFLHLTKFPKRILEFDIPPNAWMGTTVDLQARVANAEEAFAELRGKYPDATFWLSIEPMLELIKFTRLYLFNWIVIGGAARSMRTPEWRPPHRAIMDLIAQAGAVDCKVFEKTNLYGNRILELPFDAPIKTDYPQVAPDVFHYLGKNQD